ncbi:MAG TPA: hypothetical protein VFG18_10725, partial [Xanthomonadaceae bacterium]|nr:hypothetical protein [Xanthomonadaceae bacterium]
AEWRERGEGLAAAPLDRLRALLWRAAGPLRDGPALRAALAECAGLGDGWQAGLAGTLLAAALARDTSLGAHFRRDDATMRPRMVAAS